MKISEIVRVDDKKILIDALRSDIAVAAMNIYKFERSNSGDFSVASKSLYNDFEIASRVYDSILLLDILRVHLSDPKAQSRRAISELLKWYKGTLKESHV